MLEIRIYRAIATVFAIYCIWMISMADQHIGYGILAVAAIMGCNGFYYLSESKKTILLNQWYEGTGNDCVELLKADLQDLADVLLLVAKAI